MADSRSAPRPTIEQLVRLEQDKLDALTGELGDGIRSSAHYDELEQRARGIGRGLIDAFRKGRA